MSNPQRQHAVLIDREADDPTIPAHRLDLRTFSDHRGSLGVLEDFELPFEVRRLYYLYDVPADAMRGGHGHIRLQQLFICFGGTVDVVVDSGFARTSYRLEHPSEALYVPSMRWRELTRFAPNTTVLICASATYDPDDYVRDFGAFRDLARQKARA